MKHLSNFFFKKRETDESENDRIHLKIESKLQKAGPPKKWFHFDENADAFDTTATWREGQQRNGVSFLKSPTARSSFSLLFAVFFQPRVCVSRVSGVWGGTWWLPWRPQRSLPAATVRWGPLNEEQVRASFKSFHSPIVCFSDIKDILSNLGWVFFQFGKLLSAFKALVTHSLPFFHSFHPDTTMRVDIDWPNLNLRESSRLQVH